MKKYITLGVVLLTTAISFSQNTEAAVTKKTIELEVPYTLVVVPDEGTNNPETNGYTKEIINGKEVYVKRNNRVKSVYTPINN